MRILAVVASLYMFPVCAAAVLVLGPLFVGYWAYSRARLAMRRRTVRA